MKCDLEAVVAIGRHLKFFVVEAGIEVRELLLHVAVQHLNAVGNGIDTKKTAVIQGDKAGVVQTLIRLNGHGTKFRKGGVLHGLVDKGFALGEKRGKFTRQYKVA